MHQQRERYQPDAFRYFVAVAGPETQDSDFSWSEFVRRTNDELVAGWGNLVNRSISMAAKNFGEIPAAVDLTPADVSDIGSVVAKITVEGARYPEHLQQLVGR